MVKKQLILLLCLLSSVNSNSFNLNFDKMISGLGIAFCSATIGGSLRFAKHEYDIGTGKKQCTSKNCQLSKDEHYKSVIYHLVTLPIPAFFGILSYRLFKKS